MGVVSEYLRAGLEKQLNEHRLVVWCDPECQYEEFVTALDLPAKTVACYRNSFLRRLNKAAT